MGYSVVTVALHVCLFPIYIKYDFSDTFNIFNLSSIIPGIKVVFSICLYNLKRIHKCYLITFNLIIKSLLAIIAK